LSEKNLILDDIKGAGGLKQENELFKELLEFEKDVKKKVSNDKNKIIDFFPSAEETPQSIVPMRLAAESSESASAHQRKSDFLTSSDGKMAIKYIKKENEEIHITLLSDSEDEMQEVILHLPEIGKYFTSNLKGDFVIGQYSDFNFDKFHFKAVLPMGRIIILKNSDNFTAFSSDKLLIPEITGINNSFMFISINYDKDFSSAVLNTKKTKDFVKIENTVIELPLMLLEDKSSLLLY